MASIETEHMPCGEEKIESQTTCLPTSTSDLYFGHKHKFRHYHIISRPFAGRLGGNQHFSLHADTAEKQDLLERVPDAAPYLEWRESFDLHPFLQVEMWRQALVEGYATCIFVFLNGWVCIMNMDLVDGTPIQDLLAVFVGETELVLSIALLVYATAPVSGGHMNPMVSIATFLARLTSFPRMVLYVAFQLLGATVGAFLIRATYGAVLPAKAIGGCYIDPAQVTAGQVYAFETMASVALLYLLFGTAIDPHQKHCYGPSFSIVLVGLSFGLVTMMTWPVKPGYSGVSVNPARCFGLMAASERWDYHYVLWMGDITAAVVNALYIRLVPVGRRSSS